jgi:TatA/E family protein of Tat protein translocase
LRIVDIDVPFDNLLSRGGKNMGEFSLSHLIIVLVIFLLIFGPSRLGDLGSSLGKGIKGFKKAMREPDEIDVTPSKDEISRIEGTHLETTGTAAEKKEEAK